MKTVTIENVNFNAEAISAMPKAQFVDENGHQWPDKTESERTAALEGVHDACCQAVKGSVIIIDEPLTPVDGAAKEAYDATLKARKQTTSKPNTDEGQE
jgi:hypothetical protein